MKYLINKMGLIIRVFASILKVNGSNLTSGVCVINNGKLIEYSPI